MLPLTDLLNIQRPIIQAPMAGVQDWELAAAVSVAGGLGSIPCAMLTPQDVRESVIHFRERTSHPVNLNFFCHRQPVVIDEQQRRWLERFRPYYAELDVDMASAPSGASRQPFNQEMARVVSELKPEIVSFHFGLPDTVLLQQVKDSGAKIISSATTVEEACWLEQQGVDAIIAQGIEAGGHRGMFLTEDPDSQTSIFALLPQIVTAVNVPVIAAGGIADAEDVRNAMSLGASGVQVGTAYLLCHEAKTSPVHREVLQSDAARHTVLTNVFSGRLARGIVNRMIREQGPINPAAPPFPLATAASAPLRSRAESLGSGDFTPLWAGQNVTGCRPVSAGELTRLLASACNNREKP
ncbi:NAD(P)H-dependent flavin oxidoreductase [Marinobacterium sediminicola]|uniref:Propionate 3-nitronate monooxygenase n=1 Tax=Marinobacterium sediminicola TaxID=518898 RepID=A0ABY1RXB4_9GAMM|nr:nitronate monooxygenase [Marinobacterium sediminicola]ULG67800.1 nitronate monooxygenase [Marinobacterium sediminicola]SMR71524.1 nitronate monooxygenase [Marinobacterium sediminicola]